MDFMGETFDKVEVCVSARTDTGMVREGNEDAFMIADLTSGNLGLGPDMKTHKIGARGSLMAVSDGMGGAAAGEIASEIAVKTVRKSLMEVPENLDVCEQLKQAAENANAQIWKYAEQNPEYKGMGATLTAVLIQEAKAYIAQVGDSRAYLVRNHSIKQLTKDQSLVQEMIDAGAIAAEQAEAFPQNLITQALGVSQTLEVPISSIELVEGDTLIICSDGLSQKVKEADMVNLVQQTADLTALCRGFVALANQRGGEDNITVIAAQFAGELLHSAAERNSITRSFKPQEQDCENAQ
jgi:PPM family protein phosphatase